MESSLLTLTKATTMSQISPSHPLTIPCTMVRIAVLENDLVHTTKDKDEAVKSSVIIARALGNVANNSGLIAKKLPDPDTGNWQSYDQILYQERADANFINIPTPAVLKCGFEFSQKAVRGDNYANRGYTNRDNYYTFQQSYGVVYVPKADDRDTLRGVHIGGLPKDIGLRDVLARVRGGRIYSSVLLDTMNVSGSNSALITFMNQANAEAKPDQGNYHSSPYPYIPLFPAKLKAIFEFNRTRILTIRNFPQHISLRGLESDLAGRNALKANSLLEWYIDEEGTLRMEFVSMDEAVSAFGLLSSSRGYKDFRLVLQFERDSCEGDLEELEKEPEKRNLCFRGLNLELERKNIYISIHINNTKRLRTHTDTPTSNNSTPRPRLTISTTSLPPPNTNKSRSPDPSSAEYSIHSFASSAVSVDDEDDLPGSFPPKNKDQAQAPAPVQIKTTKNFLASFGGPLVYAGKSTQSSQRFKLSIQMRRIFQPKLSNLQK
ncbi:ac945097-44ba-4252-a9cb-d8cbc9275230 [Sclerotinia trifoliorum]|uniref:Ac945097-44ba-4252-a9cb-d8cbc9275230 n=1 Tax=Sclerotinia trifoliorum TaxID=28548 RepID=A0A8H2ZRW0_9HELO|nr:ac945097-44ba-4252-a9cb-d8cbc9275230 [Sclerotinia trifoliorum]